MQNKIVKIFSSLLVSAIIILGIAQTSVYAANTTEKTIKLSYYRYVKDGNGYKQSTEGYALSGNPVHPIFQILSIDSSSKNVLGTDFYCLNAESGATWLTGDINQEIKYSKSTDLVKEKANVADILPDKIYTQVMWILDNMYTESGTLTIQQLLENAGIRYYDAGATDTSGNSIGKHYYYDGTKIGSTTKQYDTEYGAVSGYMVDNDGKIEDVILSKELVESVQQSVIWYFTNYVNKESSKYDKYDEKDRIVKSWLEYAGSVEAGGINWKELYGADGTTVKGQKSRMLQEQASILYNYFVDSANHAAENGYTTSTEGTLKLEYTNSSSESVINEQGSNYVIGPMKLTTTGTVSEIKLQVKTGTDYGTTIDSNKISLKNKSDKTITTITSGEEFYITIPKTEIQKSVQISVSGTSTATTKTLWMDAAGVEQPIVEVKKETKPVKGVLTASLKGEFDLALRKQIIKINGETTGIINETGLDATRKMNIDLRTIPDTATYKHRKDPVVVTTGTKVTYSISIFNEGDIDGYASKIIDQLPTGLKMSDSMSSTITSQKGNKYNVTYDSTTNKITFQITGNGTNLSAFNGTTLDKDVIEVECEVTQVAEKNGNTKHYLTNIAYIAEEYDKDGNKIEQDRNGTESSPSKSPNENADELNNEDANKYKGNKSNPSIYEDTNNEKYYEGEEDDDDFETIVVLPERFDLALRKFITAVSPDGDFTSEKSKTYNREPQVDTSKLYTEVNGSLITTATYNHSKKPISVKIGDYVLYTIRVYNEGQIDGIAGEITDYLPEYLDFVDSTDENISKVNSIWNYDATTRKVTTKPDAQIASTVLKAFDKANDDGKGSGLSYADVQIICKINNKAIVKKAITNIAEISLYKDKDGNDLPDGTDIDSDADNIKYPEDESKYKDDEINKDYVPGQEDDDDFEKVIIQDFDLALRKFITNISGTDVKTRIPQVKYSDGKITYEHPKDVVKVVVGDTVTYTIRVFNEGGIAGYAETVTDDIPEYLEYLPENETNTEYRWKMYDKDGNQTDKVENAVKIVTDYTSMDNGKTLMKQNNLSENPNLLQPFDSSKEISENNPDYVDVKVAFKVKDPNSNTTVITNKAQISEDADEDGNPVDDIDSVPDKWNDGEDDQDYENVSVEYFDLALLKYVTKVHVTEKGTTKTTTTGNTGAETDIIPKVDINQYRVKTTIVKFEYVIKITNEGDIAGYAKEITDYVPKGLKFYAEDNEDWKDEGNNVISTRKLENTLLQPGESATVTVILRGINGSDNLGIKTNIAEISEDYNDKLVPDRDSTPDNQKPGEDDIDDASVLLGISTGLLLDIMPYIGGGLAILVVLGAGIFIIKKYVL